MTTTQNDPRAIAQQLLTRVAAIMANRGSAVSESDAYRLLGVEETCKAVLERRSYVTEWLSLHEEAIRQWHEIVQTAKSAGGTPKACDCGVCKNSGKK